MNNPTNNISVKIEKVSKDILYLKQHLGDGSLGDIKFDASFILPAMNLLVVIGDNQYKVDNQDLIRAIIEYHNKQ